MSDSIIGFIRTTVPLIVATFLTWLGTFQLDLFSVEGEMIAVLTAVLTALYWLAVRLLAKWKPWFGVLLGYNVAPKYNDASPATSYNALGKE